MYHTQHPRATRLAQLSWWSCDLVIMWSCMCGPPLTAAFHTYRNLRESGPLQQQQQQQRATWLVFFCFRMTLLYYTVLSYDTRYLWYDVQRSIRRKLCNTSSLSLVPLDPALHTVLPCVVIDVEPTLELDGSFSQHVATAGTLGCIVVLRIVDRYYCCTYIGASICCIYIPIEFTMVGVSQCEMCMMTCSNHVWYNQQSCLDKHDEELAASPWTTKLQDAIARQARRGHHFESHPLSSIVARRGVTFHFCSSSFKFYQPSTQDYTPPTAKSALLLCVFLKAQAVAKQQTVVIADPEFGINC